MKKAFFCLLLCLLSIFLGCKDYNKGVDVQLNNADSAASVPAIDTLGEIVARVQQQSKLYTSECKVHKVVLFSDDTRLGGKIFDVSLPGYRKAAVPIDVTLKGYVDFSDFQASSVLMQDSLCIITLPDPHVVITSSKVDHAATRQYVSMARNRFTEAELSRLATQGADTIASHIGEYGIVERSRVSCARTLVPILQHLGFSESNIIIRFRKEYSNSELRPLTSMQK